MTVPIQQTYAEHVASGTATSFTFPFRCLQAQDLAVLLDDVEAPSGAYTVTGLGGFSGSVNFQTPPESGVKVLIVLMVRPERVTSYPRGGTLQSPVLNDDFDRLWLAIQRAFRDSGLALVKNLGEQDGAAIYRARGNRISQVGDPVAMTDAVNKQALTSALAGLSVDGSGEFVVERLADGERPDNGLGMVAMRQSEQHRVRRADEKIREQLPATQGDLGWSPGSDITSQLQPALDKSNRTVEFTRGSDFVANQASVSTDCELIGRSARVRSDAVDKGVFWFTSLTPTKISAAIKGFVFSQPDSSAPGGGGLNNHTALKFNGTEASSACWNVFDTVAMGTGLHYQASGEFSDRRDLFSVVAFNYYKNVEKMALELHGAAYAVLVGNRVNSDRTASNTIRLTGYGADEPTYTNARCVGVVAAAQTIRSGSEYFGSSGNGLSIQNATEGVCFSSQCYDGTFNGAAIHAGTVLENNPRNLNLQLVLRNNPNIAFNNFGSESSSFDLAIFNFGMAGIVETEQTRPFRTKNNYRGTIKTGPLSSGRPLEVLGSHAGDSFDLTIDLADQPDVLSSRLYGISHTGRLCVSGGNGAPVLAIGSRRSNLSLTVSGTYTTAQSSVTVPGSDNFLNISCDGRLLISGSGNVIFGRADAVRIEGNNNKLIGFFGEVQNLGSANTVS